MCNCPEPLPPPNDQIKKCRLILQILAAGLVVISILCILAGNIFGIFMYLLLIYMLFMSWSQFNWCFALVFFLFSVTDFIQNVIVLIGMYLSIYLGYNMGYFLLLGYPLVCMYWSRSSISVQPYISAIIAIGILRRWIRVEF